MSSTLTSLSVVCILWVGYMFNDTSIVLYGLLRWLSGKDPPTMQERWVQSLGRKDPLEKEMATHSSILAWRIPWTQEPGRVQSMESQRIGHDLATKQQQ